MRRLVFAALKFLKWRCLVPAFWHLGLGHDWLAERLRLAPLQGNGQALGAGSDSSTEQAQSPRLGLTPSLGSIYSVSVVSQTCRALLISEGCEGKDAVSRYLDVLISQAPEYEADVRWGEMLAIRDNHPEVALDLAKNLYRRYPFDRFGKTLLQMLNQSGSISGARKLAEELVRKDPSISRTLSLLRAREHLLDSGFELPNHRPEQSYRANPKRVFYLLHNSLPYNSGGYATRTHGLVRSLNTQGWDVECVTRLGYPADIDHTSKWIPPVDQIDDVPYFRLKDRNGTYRKVDANVYMKLNAEAVLRLARRRRPKVIHGVSNHINGLAAAYVGRLLDIPSVYEVRGLWELTRLSRQPEFEGSELYEMIVRLETQACLEVDRVITITEALKNLLVGRGVPKSKIRVVPNGVDVARFSKPISSHSSIRAKWKIPEKALVVGYIGSMPQYEGLDDLIEAVSTLPDDVRAEVRCLLVGDGDALACLRELTTRHNLGDHIHFVGRVPHAQVEQYYAAIDVLVFPRKPQPVTEAVSPIKPFEAMAMGKPIVASNVAALAEIISHGETGLLFEKGSSADLARCISRLVGEKGILETLGRQGQSWVRNNRDWDVLTSGIIEEYEALFESRSFELSTSQAN